MNAVSDLARTVVPFKAQNDAAITEEITVTVAKTTALVVTDGPSYALAGEHRRGFALLKKRIHAFFDDDIALANKLHKSLTSKRKIALDAVEAEDDRLERERLGFQRREDEKRRQLELQAQRVAQEQEQARLLAEAAVLEQSGQGDLAAAVVEQAVHAPAPSVSIASELPQTEGIGKAVENWQYEVVNEALLPRAYMMPNPKAIGGVVRAMKGATRIPGVRVWDAGSERVRT